MARTHTAAMATVLTDAVKRPVTLVEITFDTAPLRLWSGVGDLTWNAVTWTGAGHLLAVEQITEATAATITGTRLRLTGLDSAVVNDVYTEEWQQRPVRIWLGALDAAGAVVADPILLFTGRLDLVEDVEDGDGAVTLVGTAESHAADIDRPRVRRYTPEDQALIDADDSFFDQVAALQEKEIELP